MKGLRLNGTRDCSKGENLHGTDGSRLRVHRGVSELPGDHFLFTASEKLSSFSFFSHGGIT